MPSYPERAIEVSLAEFNALRAEILSRATAQATLHGVGLTALGVIVGFVVAEDADERLLLTIPLLAAVLNLLNAGHTYRVAEIGDYIRYTLWTNLRDQVGRIPSWEDAVAKRRKNRNLFATLLSEGPATALLFLSSCIAMLVADQDEDWLMIVGWLLTGISIAVPVVVGWIIRVHARVSDAGPTPLPSRTTSAS